MRRLPPSVPAYCKRQLSQHHTKPHIGAIFSGIQPTGVPHIGNYIGALRQWIQLQNESHNVFYSIVDLHALTPRPQPELLRTWKHETFAALLAAGVDPERSALFFQSSVAMHAELMWILSCTASVGYLSRMTQWKSKLALSPDATVNDASTKGLKLGLFSYPVLQAADILLYRATHVPVGDDQRQHIEFARECARNFQSTYGVQLVEPQTVTETAARIMSLQEPTQKMSKSHSNPKSRILITDSPEDINQKIMSALTDSHNYVTYDPVARPGVSNLLTILSVFDTDSRTPEELAAELNDCSLKELKQRVSDVLIEALKGVREEYLRLLTADGGRYITEIEALGARKARLRAEETMCVIREAVGI